MDYLSYYCNYEIKGTGTDRSIKGYGSFLGNVDAAGDIVAPGAFKASIAKAKSGESQWPVMLLQHSAEENPIGVWDNIDEDDHGLLVKGRLANTKQGRDIYELLKLKAMSGLSIGYRVRESENHKAGSPARRTIKAADLVEVSLVTFPSNAKARVLSVKSDAERQVDEAAAFKAWVASERERAHRMHRAAHGSKPKYG
jgi:uncharacterized protein